MILFSPYEFYFNAFSCKFPHYLTLFSVTFFSSPFLSLSFSESVPCTTQSGKQRQSWGGKVMAGKFITPAGDFNYSLKTTRQEPEPLLPAIIIHHAPVSPVPSPCSIILSTVWKTFFSPFFFVFLFFFSGDAKNKRLFILREGWNIFSYSKKTNEDGKGLQPLCFQRFLSSSFIIFAISQVNFLFSGTSTTTPLISLIVWKTFSLEVGGSNRRRGCTFR